MTKVTKKFLSISATILISLLFAIIFVQTITVSDFKSYPVKVTKAEITPEQSSVEFIYKNKNDLHSSEAIVFFTSHMLVEAYLEDDLIYTANNTGLPYFKTTGKISNVIAINQEYLNKTVTIKFTPIYSNDAKTISFYQGNLPSIMSKIFLHDVEDIFTTIALLLTTLVILFYCIMKRKNLVKDSHVIYMGIFALLIGLWRVPEINILTLLIPNGIFWSNFGLAMLSLMPILFTLGVKYIFSKKAIALWNHLMTVTVAILISTLVLQVTGTKNIREMLILTNISMVIVNLVCVYQVISDTFKTKRITPNTIKMIILLLVMLCWFLTYDLFGFSTLAGSLILLAYLSYEAVQQMITVRDYEKKVAESEAYKKLAQTDDLTKLLNKSAVKIRISKTIKTCTNGAFIIIDLDNFKKINDTFGHDFGDEVLTKSAKAISANFRDSDLIARIGGDEFLVFMKNYNEIANVEMRMKTLMKGISKTYTFNDASINVSASIGVSIFPEHGRTFDDLFKVADVEMYSVKHKTKNQYSICKN